MERMLIGNKDQFNNLDHCYANSKTYLPKMMDVDNCYVLVQWPDVQEFMEQEWFDEEAVLADDSSYFIPFNRIFNV